MHPRTDHGEGAPESPESFDIAIVGAGFAGCLAAIALGRAGLNVVLIDAQAAPSAALFRAEKISGDQLLLLRELGLFDVFKAASAPVRESVNIRGRRVIDRTRIDEYGLSYTAMIDVLRRQIPPGVFRQARVSDVELGDDWQRVILADGGAIRARLAVLAVGQGEALGRKLGLVRRTVDPRPTVCVGFSLKPPASGFGFPSLAAYGERRGDKVDYLSLFPFEDGAMRANLFTFSDIRDPAITALRERKLPALLELLPGLRPWLEGCAWVGETAIFPVELCRYDNVVRGGVVLIGDAFQVTCPAVGTGLSCALTDVVQLRKHAAAWFATPGMGADKIAAFYADPVKNARDARARKLALKRRFMKQDSLRAYLRLMAHFGKRIVFDRLRPRPRLP